MKTVNHKAKVKYSVGQKVYYKYNKKGYQTTIKKVIVETEITKNTKKPETVVYYIAPAKRGSYAWYRVDTKLTEKDLFDTKEEADKLTPAEHKSKLMRDIKQLKRSIDLNKKTIQKAKKKLEEIRKEELIEELAGIK